MSRITTDQITELLAQDKAGRVTRENLQEFLKNPGKVMAIIIATFQSLLEACHQSWVNSDINEKNFPLVDDSTKGSVEEYCLGHDVASGKEAEKELKKLGYKLVGMKRAMEYIAAHPDNQLDHPIVVVGARWQYPDGDVYVPYFFRSVSKRNLDLDWIDDDFSSHCRFLVARE